MSYIRTKDGIYEVVKNELGDLVKIDGGFILLDDIKDKIIKESDTIKELCDEFVLVEKMREVTYHHKSSKFDDFKSIAMLNERYTLYGAIWVDGKGLIYAAKMNETGELVLI